MAYLRKVSWAGLLVILLLLVSASAAAAQGGGGDKFVMGGNYVLAQGQTLNGRLVVLGGNAKLDPQSTVTGDVTVMGGTLNAAGHVHGDVGVVGGSVWLAETAVVDGNLNTLGGSVHRSPGAVVSGTTQEGARGPVPSLPFGAPDQSPQIMGAPQLPRLSSPVSFFLQLVGRFFAALGLGLLLTLIAIVVVVVAPRPTAQVASSMASQPAISFAVGLLTLVLATLIGFPLLLACGLGLLVWLLALVALLFGWVAAGLWLGQRILAALRVRVTSSLSEVALGVFLITWITWVSPRCIGWLIGLVIGCIGLGAVLLTRFGTQPGGWTGSSPASRGPRGGFLPTESDALARASDQPMPAVAPSSYVSEPGEESAPGPEGTVSETKPPEDIGPASELAAWESAATRASVVGEQSAAPGPLADAAQMAIPAAAPGALLAAQPSVSSLDDLEAVDGITPEIAERLRTSGNTTLVALATSSPDILAEVTGVSAERVQAEDWIGQARRLLG